MVQSAIGSADAPEDDTEKKDHRPLDEADIALLKTYVRAPRAAPSPAAQRARARTRLA